MTIWWICLTACLSFCLGSVVSYWRMRSYYKGKILSEMGTREFYRNQYEDLAKAYYQQLDEEVMARIRSWRPDPKDMDDAFKLAEKMAVMRELRNAGRKHQPRDDAAAPGRVHSGKLRTRH